MYSTHPIDQQEVMAYLDGELPVERAATVAAHLEQCAECRSVAENLRVVGRQLLAWQVESSPARLAERVTAALQAPAQAEPQARQKSSLWGSLVSQKSVARPWVWGVAGIALVILLLISIPRRIVRSPLVTELGPALYSPAQRTERVGDGGGGGGGSNDATLYSLAQRAERERASGTIGSKLQATVEMGSPAAPGVGQSGAAQFTGPMVVRRAELVLVTKEFDKARETVERAVREHHGYAGQLSVNAPAGAGRMLTATLRVPADELDATLSELKKLGRVEQESQAGEDVTRQYVDLGARLSNARNTEQRLIDVLRQRTGKVADILAVEQEMARVRGEIESMEAEKKSLENRVSFATLQLRLSEEYRAQLEAAPPSSETRLRNAAVEGYRNAVQAALGLVLALLSTGPTLALWLLILLALFWLARRLWRRLTAN